MFSFVISPAPISSHSACDDESRFLQSAFWAQFKARHGWKALRFDVAFSKADLQSTDDEIVGSGPTMTKKSKCDNDNAVIPVIGLDPIIYAGSFNVSLLVRTFAKKFSIAYMPMAPELFCGAKVERDNDALAEIDAQNPALVHLSDYAHFLHDFAAALRAHLPKNTLCLRFDLPLDFYTKSGRDFFVDSLSTFAFAERLALCKAKTDVQPPDTVLLDLTRSEDEILAAMKSKWRYNIRLAAKKGVSIEAYRAESEDIDGALDTFYRLYETTATRDGIAIHAKNYYADLLKSGAVQSSEEARVREAGVAQLRENARVRETDLQRAPMARSSPRNSVASEASAAQSTENAPLITLYIASHQNETLAAIITLFSKREAVYLYGASSNEKRNLMPAYLLQWRAICDAKAYGSRVYDFYGIPPDGDENHPMHGLYLFKTGFGGTEVHRPGSFDAPLSPLYKLYALAENARAFYHKRVKKLFLKLGHP